MTIRKKHYEKEHCDKKKSWIWALLIVPFQIYRPHSIASHTNVREQSSCNLPISFGCSLLRRAPAPSSAPLLQRWAKGAAAVWISSRKTIVLGDLLPFLPPRLRLFISVDSPFPSLRFSLSFVYAENILPSSQFRMAKLRSALPSYMGPRSPQRVTHDPVLQQSAQFVGGFSRECPKDSNSSFETGESPYFKNIVKQLHQSDWLQEDCFTCCFSNPWKRANRLKRLVSSNQDRKDTAGGEYLSPYLTLQESKL